MTTQMALNDACDRLAVSQYNSLYVYDLTTVTATTNIVSSNKWTLLYSVLLDKAAYFINGLVWTSSDDIVYATPPGSQHAHVALVLMHGALRGSIDWQKRVDHTCMTRLDLLL
jgi:Na+/melibiose symporter-like transporter